MRSVCLLLLLTATYAADNLKWWQKGVIYQVYPRSFKDSNNDGVGDLAGITSNLMYLADLGVSAVWLSPIYPSPMLDFGYDISNFSDVDPLYGTLQDFDEFVRVSKSLGLRVMMDLVPNHSSDQHPWFLKSLAREPGYEDYYIWRDPKGTNPDGSPIPPNNWLCEFYGSGWEYREEREQFYLHQFDRSQPDLNFSNPAVVQEMKDVITFWMNRGVDGFRIDAVFTLFESTTFEDEPVAVNSGIADPGDNRYLAHIYTRDQPENYEMVRQWRELIDNQTAIDQIDRIIMVEMYGALEPTIAFYGTEDAPIAHFPFNIQFIPAENKTGARQYKKWINEWLDRTPNWGWPDWLTGNHDNHRIGSRVGADLIDGMNILIMTLPGTAITYYGEEIGMLDNFAISYKDGMDPNGCNYPTDKWYIRSRDFERTPYQWNAKINAGFNDGYPTWIPVHSNYKHINLEAQRRDNRSHYHVYRDLLHTVRTQEVIRRGAVTVQVTGRYKNTLAVFRHLNSTVFSVSLINFSHKDEIINLSRAFPVSDTARLKVQVASKSFRKQKGEYVLAGQLPLPARSSVVLFHHVL